jgi:hypothetical protein
MDRRGLVQAYGVGRLVFGATTFLAPARVGTALLGPEAASNRDTLVSVRTYGTRDIVLGCGAILAARRGGAVGAWLAAGIAADLLDTAAQALDWQYLPADRRTGGVAFAVGAAVAGTVLLAANRRRR